MGASITVNQLENVFFELQKRITLCGGGQLAM